MIIGELQLVVKICLYIYGLNAEWNVDCIKMKQLSVIVLLLIHCLLLGAQTRYALIIGIGDYPEETGWAKINGDNDILYVQEMLLANSFHSENIITLKNSEATFNGIINGFDSIIQKAKSGDCVYIHFSGHGQRITDVDGDEKDSKYDEAWIPYDARKAFQKGVYEGGNHLIDDKINELLWNIREKIGGDGNIVVVSDACHSGGSTRAESDSVVIRGTSDIFEIPLQEHCNAPTNNSDWVFISACKSYQINQEYAEKKCGSLTYALYKERNSLNAISIVDLFERVKTNMGEMRLRSYQTPTLECPNEDLKNCPLVK